MQWMGRRLEVKEGQKIKERKGNENYFFKRETQFIRDLQLLGSFSLTEERRTKEDRKKAKKRGEMDPDSVKSTLSNLAFGNVMAAAARDYQKVRSMRLFCFLIYALSVRFGNRFILFDEECELVV